MNRLKENIKDLLKSVKGTYSFALEWRGERVTLQAEEKCEAASLIKLPILLEAYHQYEEEKIDLHQPLTVPMEKRVGGSGVIAHLSSRIHFTLKDLLTLMIIVSDNTATNLVIEQLGMERVNRFCQLLGLKQTRLERLLFDQQAVNEGQNNYTSAHDMLICLREITEGRWLSHANRADILHILEAQQFTNKLPAQIVHYADKDPIIAHKTGEVHRVEHDVGIIRYRGEQVLVAILLKDLHSNAVGRKAIADIGQLILSAIDTVLE